MCGDPFGQNGVGGGGKVDRAASGVLLLKILEKFAIVREMGDVKGDGSGQVALQGCFTLEEPAGEFEQFRRVVAGQCERRIDEGIGFDQGSVQIDTEGVEADGRVIRWSD
jgi:hypothetical protein